MNYLKEQNILSNHLNKVVYNPQFKATASSTWSFDVVMGLAFQNKVVLKSMIAIKN